MAYTKSGSITLARNAYPNHMVLAYDSDAQPVVQVTMQQNTSGTVNMVGNHYTAASTITNDATLLADTLALMARWQVQAAADNGFTES